MTVEINGPGGCIEQMSDLLGGIALLHKIGNLDFLGGQVQIFRGESAQERGSDFIEARPENFYIGILRDIQWRLLQFFQKRQNHVLHIA